MNFKFADKYDFNAILRVIIYFVAGCIALVLTRTMSSVLISFTLTIISVCALALLFARMGYSALILSLIPVLFIGFTDSYTAAFTSASYVILAAAIGISLKNNARPSDIILVSSSAYVLVSVVFVATDLILANGFLSFSEYLGVLNNNLNEMLNRIVATYSEITGLAVNNTSELITNAKALLPGSIISAFVISACISYFATIALSRVVRDTEIYKGKTMFDIKPSHVSAWVFVISIIFSAFFGTGQSDIHFYTYLPTNLSTILSPVFVFSGIYYLVNIKFKVEHASPAFTIFVFAASLLTGMFQIIIVYLAFCGTSYTLKMALAAKIYDSFKDKE